MENIPNADEGHPEQRSEAKKKFLKTYTFFMVMAIFPVIPGLIGGFLIGQSRYSPIALARRFPAVSAMLGRRILVIGLLMLMVVWPIALFLAGEAWRILGLLFVK